MKKHQSCRDVVFLAITCMLLACCFPARAENVYKENTRESMIARYMESYNGFHIPSSIINEMKASFPELTVEYDGISVHINELIYDGIWMYTAAAVSPINGNETLILPGSASVEDLVCGMNGEDERNDQRTFIEAAKEDQKQLLAVYVYPKEFDEVGSYFLDHFQLANNISILLSGANVSSLGKNISITWIVEIYRVDLNTGKYLLSSRLESDPEKIEERALYDLTYEVSNETNTLFHTVHFLYNKLNCYIWIDNMSNEELASHDLVLLDSQGNLINAGMPPETNSFSIDEFADTYKLIFDGEEYIITKR